MKISYLNLKTAHALPSETNQHIILCQIFWISKIMTCYETKPPHLLLILIPEV